MTPFILSLILLLLAIYIGYGLGWGLGNLMANVGKKFGVVSLVTHRSSHAQPTSRLGGVALCGAFFAAFGFFMLGLWFLPRTMTAWGGNLHLLVWLLAGAFIMFVVGLADDLWNLPPLVKLLGQILALVPIYHLDLRFLDLKFAAIWGLSPVGVSLLLSLVWVLFFVNAFNFMDGMDGFATRFSMSVCFWIFVTAVLRAALTPETSGLFDLRAELLMVPILGGVCSGFYRVNRPPARVFMGDSGSLFLGYLLAVQLVLADGEYYMGRAGISAAQTGWGPTIPAITVSLLLGPFVFDVIVTLLRRARLGENLLSAHRSHLYQRLMITGMSHREVLLLNLRYFRICGALGLVAACFSNPWVRGAALLGGAIAMIHYWRLVLRKESNAREAASPRDPGPARNNSKILE